MSLFPEDIDRFRDFLRKSNSGAVFDPAKLCIDVPGKLDDACWEGAVKGFFGS